MKDTKMYEHLLGLEVPWRVQAVELRLTAGEVLIHVEAAKERWACPECGRRMQVHDYRVRRWRHLDTCQFKTLIQARVPRVKCAEHGTQTAQVPRAEKHSRFPILFERLAIDMLHDCSISAASQYLRLSWDEADHIKAKAVARGLRRKGEVESTTICIDEKSVGRGQDYITVLLKLLKTGPIVDYLADGRDASALDAFWAAHRPSAKEQIRCVSMEMWAPHLRSVETHLPAGKQAVTHDPFHILKHMNEAVDAVRRQEIVRLPNTKKRALRGTRFMWLYGFEKLPEQGTERLREWKHSQLKTARAWRLKEALRAMYQQCETWAQGEAFFKDWNRDAMRSKLASVKKVARMVKAHLHQVLNFFVHRVTNAYSEGINSTIQALIKRANGYRKRECLKRDLFFTSAASISILL